VNTGGRKVVARIAEDQGFVNMVGRKGFAKIVEDHKFVNTGE
jgi:hypothetical protein